jgi:hypothetical protein
LHDLGRQVGFSKRVLAGGQEFVRQRRGWASLAEDRAAALQAPWGIQGTGRGGQRWFLR